MKIPAEKQWLADITLGDNFNFWDKIGGSPNNNVIKKQTTIETINAPTGFSSWSLCYPAAIFNFFIKFLL